MPSVPQLLFMVGLSSPLFVAAILSEALADRCAWLFAALLALAIGGFADPLGPALGRVDGVMSMVLCGR